MTAPLPPGPAGRAAGGLGGQPDVEAGDEGLAMLPAFEAGGRVDRTGIALIHEGEHIYPAPGSSAVISPVELPDRQPVTYSFPVEVEIVGELGEEHVAAIARAVFDELDTALRGRG